MRPVVNHDQSRQPGSDDQDRDDLYPDCGRIVRGQRAEYCFRGAVGTVTLAVTLQALGAGQFVRFANGSGADLSCMSLPITIELTIGDDHGSVQLTQGSATFNSN